MSEYIVDFQDYIFTLVLLFLAMLFAGVLASKLKAKFPSGLLS